MTDSPLEDTTSFLARQPRDVLVAVLLELARDHEAVQARPDRLVELYLADQYGARDELLRSANLLLDEAAQRALVAKLDARLSAAVDTCPTPERPSNEIHVLSGALSLLSESLRDPDVKVRALLRRKLDATRARLDKSGK